MLVFLLCIILGIPFAVLSSGIFLVLRKIPSWPAQCLIPMVAGILAVVSYTSMVPPDPGDPATLMFLTGVLGNPLLILPPIILMQKYLHHFRSPGAVFFTAFLASCFIIGWGTLQGDMKFDESSSVLWQSARTVLSDLIAASGASGLVIGLDRLLPGSGEENS